MSAHLATPPRGLGPYDLLTRKEIARHLRCDPRHKRLNHILRELTPIKGFGRASRWRWGLVVAELEATSIGSRSSARHVPYLAIPTDDDL